MRDAKSISSEVPSVAPWPRATLSVCWSVCKVAIRRTCVDTVIVLCGGASVLIVDVLTAIAIGARVGRLVLEEFEQTVESHSEQGAKNWANPVNPVVAVEAPRDNVRSKRPCWVQGGASIEDTCRDQSQAMKGRKRMLTSKLSHE